MKSKRTPDRVHVVRPPENDGYRPQTSQNVEIVRTLAKVGDKLKRSEAERYELLAELREYRRSLRDLEDKAEQSEKAYLAVENKLNSSSLLDADVSQRQIRFERSLKDTEDKMLKSIAGQAIIDKRLQDTEDKQTVLDQRLDQSLSDQVSLSRQMKMIGQDKALLLRKVERLEEIILETQATLRAGSRVLLEDKNQKPSELSMPAWSNVTAQKTEEAVAEPKKKTTADIKPINWSKYINVQSVSAVGLVFAALLMGWSINQMQKPQQPVFDAPVRSSLLSPVENATKASVVTEPTPSNVLDYSDKQLLEALDADPDQLAAKLNNIEPSAVDATQDSAQPAITNPQITPEMENFEAVAFSQDPKIEQAVKAEKDSRLLAQKIQVDSNLPSSLKRMESQAFKGNAEAQHDLAAVYTAGHAGVEQNFDKAALWFREASDNGIANARYNLGVLYHQGLGQERDLSRALYWYREAAKLNHAEAQYNLGIAHIEGIGTEYNPQLAAAYFERAANEGIMEAAYNLGLIHDNGLMGQSKPDEALLWYKIAADQGSVEAKAAMEQLAKSLQIGMDDVDNLVDRMQIINESVKGRRAGPLKKSSDSKVNKTSSMASDSALVTQVQEYLMLTGAYAGPADGVNGKATRESIRSYQAANGLDVDGVISEALLNSMVGGAMERLNLSN